MEKEFIPYTEAKALKELGFNEECFTYWYTTNGINPQLAKKDTSFDGWKNYADSNTIAPLWQQAFDWFMNVHDLESYIRKLNTYYYHINGSECFEGGFKYEEARLECLKKLIEIVKNR